MQNNIHKFSLKNFDGPLDLLLFLIKDKKIDILDIDILSLAEQYLKYIAQMDNSDLEIASKYLLMSATLIQLKSKSLLEAPDDKKEFEIDKNILLKQLAEYQQFKIIKMKLKKREIIRQKIFIKSPDSLDEYIRKENPTKLDGHADPVKLIMILRKMFERTYAQKLSVGTISTNNISPEKRIEEILLMLEVSDKLEFDKVFDVPSMKHFIVTLIALLDLAKREYITLRQNEEFGEIDIIKGAYHE